MSNVQEILQNLVSFPVLGGQGNLSILHYIEQYLKAHQISYTLVPHSQEAKASLHCRIGPPIDGGIILSGHTDVVPVEGQAWNSDPFQLTLGGDKLYGRGACDMKGFLACCLAALPEMIEADLKKPIYFAFSYDEEVGCLAAPDLVASINQTYDEKPTYAIIGEPSLMQPIVGQKGICVFKTTVNGSAGHSSRIRREVSAIHEASRLILWLEAKMDDLIKSGHIDERFEPPHTSIHIGKVQGGVAHNIIADQCSFLWDVRVIPRDRVEEIKQDFENFCRQREEILCSRFVDFTIKTEIYHPNVPPLDTPEHFPIVDLVKKFSGNNQLGTVSFATEAGQFAEGGFQSIICGPGSIEQAHRANEFIAVEQLEKGMDFMRELIKSFS